MKNNKAIILTAILICLASTAIISAQTNDSKRIEVSGGYSYTRAAQLIESPNLANGWTVGTAYKLKKQVSIYAEVGEDYGKFTSSPGFTYIANRTSTLGGIRFHLVNKSRFTPFVNVGFGCTEFRNTLHRGNTPLKLPTTKNFLFAGGGGFDITLNQKRTISWRTSAEYRRLESGEDAAGIHKNGNAIRFNTGVVFHF